VRIIKLALLSVCAATFCALLGPSTKADDWNEKTIVTINAPVEIPGKVLLPGTYVFKLADSQSDRHIVEIWNADQNQLISTVMAIPDYRMDAPQKTIVDLAERPVGSPMAIESWFYAGENTGQQFVYPDRN